MPPPLKHVFVLMFENRSFDHMLGFSALHGIDAATGAATSLDGLTGQESNTFDGISYPVSRGADYAMSSDPGHEFENVLDQLCTTSLYVPPYPAITSGGFVSSHVQTCGTADPGEIMKCFDTRQQLPVLYTLAQQFAVCDRWFASLPGPTWPNRMFVHAASSGGLDHSPSTAEIVEWETLDGFSFLRGTIFDALRANQRTFHLYSGDDFPMVSALKGLTLADVDRIDKLVTDLATSPFPYDYVFIEPSYETLQDYRGSSCQHPLADVRDGEALLKRVYEALRSSPIWNESVLVVIWDEHGGFYDHVPPPAAPAPGDTPVPSKYNQNGFTFEQHGVRVPALVISPLVPRNTIDHRPHDHASVPASLEELFGLPAMTKRDAGATSVLSLLSLGAPRTDTPLVLPSPAPVASPAPAPQAVTRPGEALDDGMLPTIVHAAMRQDLEMSPAAKGDILARVAALRTRQDAMAYLQQVRAKLRAR